MRAAILEGPGRIGVHEVDRPVPGPGQVRIKLHGCGVCASSLPLWEGRPWFEYPRLPGEPGHEGWGVIDEVGADVEGLKVGTPVAALNFRGFAEYDLAEAATVVPLSGRLAATPFPAEPVACAVNAFRRSDIREGTEVAVVGIGFLGALLTAMSVEAGAQVTAIGRRPYALELARRLGASRTVRLTSGESAAGDALAEVGEKTFPRVIEATGAQLGIELASELIGERGRLIVAGYHQDGGRLINLQQWNWKGIDVVNAHERDPLAYAEGMRLAAGMVAEERIDLEGMITHRMSLEELPAAFRLMKERPRGFLKAVIVHEQ